MRSEAMCMLFGISYNGKLDRERVKKHARKVGFLVYLTGQISC